MKVRIEFKKYGTMKFIDHLDAMRYFRKAIRRSDVEICYSGGFNPHRIMFLAALLGTGAMSGREYVDIEVFGTEDSRATINRPNQVMSERPRIISFRELPDTAGNAMPIVAAADYTVAFRSGYELRDMSAEEWSGELLAFYEQPEVVATKKTKRGQTELDIKPLVYDLRLTRGEDGNTALFMRISTGSSSNLKSELVLDVYYDHLGQERTAFALLIQREEVHAGLGGTDQKEKGNHTFISLEELGQETLQQISWS